VRVQDAAPPPTDLPTPTLEETRKLNKTVVQQATGALPGASIADAVRDSQRIGMQIMPALRAGDYKGAAAAFVQSTAAALGAIPEVHNLAGFAGIIAAYHGSPHLFDEFKSSAIGTGEGAQMYGHGLYFAEDPKVAGTYRQSVSAQHGVGKTIDGLPINDVARGSDEVAYIAELTRDAKSTDAAREMVAKRAENYLPVFDKLHGEGKLSYDPGAIYSVKLDVNHEDLLDWDKPLTAQPPGVRKAIETLGGDHAALTKDMFATGKVVMFDPSLIKIEAVNGQPAPAAAEKAADGMSILAHPEAWGAK
jgi:hypothetical protein